MISVHFVAFFILDIINDSQVISVLLFIFYAAQMTEIEGIKYIVVHLLEVLNRDSTRISRAHLSEILNTWKKRIDELKGDVLIFSF